MVYGTGHILDLSSTPIARRRRLGALPPLPSHASHVRSYRIAYPASVSRITRASRASRASRIRLHGDAFVMRQLNRRLADTALASQRTWRGGRGICLRGRLPEKSDPLSYRHGKERAGPRHGRSDLDASGS
jgi:hypothetical protein